ncbi:hypothetical protein QJS10_CPA02g01303 [Acorus calamus]|uniref:Uncharacterized protein n=1 Tax=Acorus calamus TaxID=4465 RepID=A0AAV9FDM4_ACOCL|nr:hypothetical protein QJS10_CPA02g01303 [Acorus calamus]
MLTRTTRCGGESTANKIVIGVLISPSRSSPILGPPKSPLPTTASSPVRPPTTTSSPSSPLPASPPLTSDYITPLIEGVFTGFWFEQVRTYA